MLYKSGMGFIFGTYLSNLRKSKGISAQEIARQLGVSPTYISRIEKGKNIPPNFDVCQQIMKCLGLEHAEEKRFLSLAFVDRVSGSNDEFFKAIGQPSFEAIDMQHIPIISLPDEPVTFPIKSEQLLGTYIFGQPDISDTLFIVHDLDTFNLSDKVGPQDVLLFDASVHDVSDDDIVLVSENGETCLKQAKTYNQGDYIQFLPEINETVYKASANNDEFCVIAKLAVVIKKH